MNKFLIYSDENGVDIFEAKIKIANNYFLHKKNLIIFKQSTGRCLTKTKLWFVISILKKYNIINKYQIFSHFKNKWTTSTYELGSELKRYIKDKDIELRLQNVEQKVAIIEEIPVIKAELFLSETQESYNNEKDETRETIRSRTHTDQNVPRKCK